MGPPEVSVSAENVTAERALTDHSIQSLLLAIGVQGLTRAVIFPGLQWGKEEGRGRTSSLIPQLDLSPSPREPPFELMGVLHSMYMSLK